MEAGVKDDKNFIYGIAFFGSGSLPGSAVAGGKRIAVRLTKSYLKHSSS
jgi:hypothetical protein